MAILTNYYVDPAGGNDTTGNGSIGTPWKTVQKALNTITRDSTNGDQINVKAGGTDTLSAELNPTTYGTPTLGAPLVIRGYTSAANDGGQGVISGGGTVEIWNESARSFYHFIDMRLTANSGASGIRVGAQCSLIRCEIDSFSAAGIITGANCLIDGCNIHNIPGRGIECGGVGTIVQNCYLKNGASDFTAAIYFASSDGCIARRNIISIDGTTDAFDSGASFDGGLIVNNSVFSAGGTGQGIDATSWQYGMILNNLIEGFSGGGGVGILFDNSSTRRHLMVRGNAVYNCATAYSNNSDKLVVEQDPTSSDHDNETLSASPFAKSGSDTFANRFVYFAPVDTGNVIGGAYVAA